MQPGADSDAGISLNDFQTDYWVKHSYYPSEGSSINYRLQHIIATSVGHVFTVFFESQTRDAEVNQCVQNTFFPLTLVWRGPILVMKQTAAGEAQDCLVSDMTMVIDLIKRSVGFLPLVCLITLNSMIWQFHQKQTKCSTSHLDSIRHIE